MNNQPCLEHFQKEWSVEELKKFVILQTARMMWLEDNPVGTPIPNWVNLSLPFDKEDELIQYEEYLNES